MVVVEFLFEGCQQTMGFAGLTILNELSYNFAINSSIHLFVLILRINCFGGRWVGISCNEL